MKTKQELRDYMDSFIVDYTNMFEVEREEILTKNIDAFFECIVTNLEDEDSVIELVTYINVLAISSHTYSEDVFFECNDGFDIPFDYDQLIELSVQMKSDYERIINKIFDFVTNNDKDGDIFISLVDILCIVNNKEMTKIFIEIAGPFLTDNISE